MKYSVTKVGDDTLSVSVNIPNIDAPPFLIAEIEKQKAKVKYYNEVDGSYEPIGEFPEDRLTGKSNRHKLHAYALFKLSEFEKDYFELALQKLRHQEDEFL